MGDSIAQSTTRRNRTRGSFPCAVLGMRDGRFCICMSIYSLYGCNAGGMQLEDISGKGGGIIGRR